MRGVTGEKRRLNLKLEEGLVSWAFAYAERRGTTVTQMIGDLLRDMRRQDTENSFVDAEQV